MAVTEYTEYYEVEGLTDTGGVSPRVEKIGEFTTEEAAKRAGRRWVREKAKRQGRAPAQYSFSIASVTSWRGRV